MAAALLLPNAVTVRLEGKDVLPAGEGVGLAFAVSATELQQRQRNVSCSAVIVRLSLLESQVWLLALPAVDEV